jgi:hypothetical protein
MTSKDRMHTQMMDPASSQTPTRATHRNRACFSTWGNSRLLPVLLYSLLVTVYIVLRYGVYRGEPDTSVFTAAIRDMFDQGVLVPRGTVYTHGFSYQTVSVYLLNLCGLPVQLLQIVIYPLVMGVILPILGYSLFKLLLGEARTAMLATLFLFLQPEFLFVISRGSHERVTWVLTITALLLLAKSSATITSYHVFVPSVLLFYVVTFALSTSNSFFSSSFVSAIVFSLAVYHVLKQIGLKHSALVRTDNWVRAFGRLKYIVPSCLILVYLVLFFVYTPAQHWFFTALRATTDRVSALFLSVEATAEIAETYAPITYGWTSRYVYFGLTVFNYFVLLVSFAEWLVRSWKYFLRGESDNPPALLLWILYPAFVFQFVTSIIVDLAGVLSNNLQLRLLTPLMLLSIPLAVAAIVRLAKWSYRGGSLSGRLVRVGLVLLTSWFGAAALIKGTNDPTVSNVWLFYRADEKQALVWTEGHLVNSEIWDGPDARLKIMLSLESIGGEGGNRYYGGLFRDTTRYVIGSSVSRAYSARRKIPFPNMQAAHITYDNGTVSLYQYRPNIP